MSPIKRLAASSLPAMLLAAKALAPVPAVASTPDGAGPYNARFLEGGIGLERAPAEGSALLRESAPFKIAA